MKPISRAERRWLVVLGGYLALIFVLSSLPGPVLGRVGISVWDKAAHAIEYAIVGFLTMGWITARHANAPSLGWRALVVSVAISLAAGAFDELHQAFVPTRTASFLDLAADGVGATLGALVGFGLFRILRRRGARRSARG